METKMEETKPTPPAKPIQDPTEKRTAEQWAEFRGHLPQVTREAPPADKPQKVMPAIHNPEHRHYQGARFLVFGGVIGKEVTLKEYDAAVAAAKAHVYR
jgi:hypothetical protein